MNKDEPSHYSIQGFHKPVGYLEIVKSYCVATSQKPNWLHRLMMRLLLGWKWEDAS